AARPRRLAGRRGRARDSRAQSRGSAETDRTRHGARDVRVEGAADAGRGARRAARGARSLSRRAARGVHRADRSRDAGSGTLRRRSRRRAAVRREPARDHRARPLLACEGVARRPRVRDAGGYTRRRARHLEASRAIELRGRGGGPDAGRDHRRAAREDRRAVIDTGVIGRIRRHAVRDNAAPDRVTIERLIALRAAGESLKIGTPRVRAVGAGGHLSTFKGRGVEFDESRPYQPGDDPRTMDWRVTARTGKPHTKVFREERNRPVMLWVDLRAAMRFGTQRACKAVRAAEAAALIAWSAVANGDRLGGLVFSDTEHDERRPRLGRRAALTLLQLVADEAFWGPREPARGGEDRGAEHALARLARVARPGSPSFLLSDFHGLGDEAERHLRHLASHGDVSL